MELIRITDGVEYHIDTPKGIPIVFSCTNVRPEKTGIHGTLAIKYDESDTYTVCNILRQEERTRLTNRAYKFLGTSIEDAEYTCKKSDLVNKFDKFCAQVWPAYIEVHAPEEIAGVIDESAVSYLAKPHVLTGGGTIMYGKPGQGKSYTAMIMAVAVNAGLNHYWDTEKSKSVYLNLERPDRTIAPRIGTVNKALGLDPSEPLTIMNEKSKGLLGIRDALSHYIQKNNVGFVVLDSISRSQMGDMKEDTVATITIDLLNDLGVSWLGVAHTPKYDDSIYYGNSQYEAGADVMIRHKSEIIDDEGSLALLLEVTKANDMPVPRPMKLHYSFDATGLSAIRFAKDFEVANLIEEKEDLKGDILYTLKRGKMSVPDLAKELDKPRKTISEAIDYLYRKGTVSLQGTQGIERVYGLPVHDSIFSMILEEDSNGE